MPSAPSGIASPPADPPPKCHRRARPGDPGATRHCPSIIAARPPSSRGLTTGSIPPGPQPAATPAAWMPVSSTGMTVERGNERKHRAFLPLSPQVSSSGLTRRPGGHALHPRSPSPRGLTTGSIPPGPQPAARPAAWMPVSSTGMTMKRNGVSGHGSVNHGHPPPPPSPRGLTTGSIPPGSQPAARPAERMPVSSTGMTVERNGE